jgi:hypothetical protein
MRGVGQAQAKSVTAGYEIVWDNFDRVFRSTMILAKVGFFLFTFLKGRCMGWRRRMCSIPLEFCEQAHSVAPIIVRKSA